MAKAVNGNPEVDETVEERTEVISRFDHKEARNSSEKVLRRLAYECKKAAALAEYYLGVRYTQDTNHG